LTPDWFRFRSDSTDSIGKGAHTSGRNIAPWIWKAATTPTIVNERCRVRPNAEREREHGHGGEAGALSSWRMANLRSFMREGENIEHRTSNIERRRAGKAGR